MLLSGVRIAALLVLSGAVAAATVEAASARPGGVAGGGGMRASVGGGGGGGARPSFGGGGGMRAIGGGGMSAAPMARGFSAPRVMSAPRMMATPRVMSAPRIASTPRIAPQGLNRPQGLARQIGGPSSLAAAKNAPTPRALAGAGPGQPLGARNLNPQGRPGQAFQLASANQGGPRVLRNQFLANRAGVAGVGGRNFTRATFAGGFANHWRHHHHRFRPVIVIGWVGPLFWPYAYSDFVDYTFYPYAYDRFWPSAYDDVYAGMFGPYALGYGGGSYRVAGRPQGSGGGTAGSGRSSGGPVAADLCSGQTAGLTDWPIERITQTVEPNEAQRAALDELKTATAAALDILKASCPTDLPSTPTGRLAAMQKRLDAMSQAVRTVRPALEKFYQSLNDEQKARFNALGPDENQQQTRRDLTQMCGERAAGIGSLPTERIERAVRPTDAQRGTLKELQDAMSEAGNVLKTDCPTYRPLTPIGRLEAMEQRLTAMLRAVTTVQPALERFYGVLSDEQKERFNRLGPAQS
jgi:hypothetical protein